MRQVVIIVVLVVLAIGTRVVSGTRHGGGMFASGTDQVLFILDDSGSMTQLAFPRQGPPLRRWEVVQRAYPQWLARLGHRHVRIGARSIGGACGAVPRIALPVGSAAERLAAALTDTAPSGSTNLNAALRQAPDAFDVHLRGRKRIILLSDGQNTCPPRQSTCELARTLHRDYDIVIDAAIWSTGDRMDDAFACITRVTGGRLLRPDSLEDWLALSFPVPDLMRYVVLALSVLTLLLAAIIAYRHGHHVFGWRPGRAVTVAGGLLGLGTLTVLLVLFPRVTMKAAALGLSVLILLLLVRRRRRRHPVASPLPWSGAMWGLILCLLMAPAGPPAAAASTAAFTPACHRAVQGAPRHHHLLALDVSGSVVKHLDAMKALLSCYATTFTLPGEEITLIVFGMDRLGSVDVVRTLTVPPQGAAAILHHLLTDVAIRNPRQTRTYFRPLADVLNRLLAQVQQDPVVVVVSDGKSNGFTDARAGRVSFAEIPFERLGTHGIYTAPGIRGWRVAIAGGYGLDLSQMFQRPRMRAQSPGPVRDLRTAALDPCLLDPPLVIKAEQPLVLSPSWFPLAPAHGTLRLTVSHACVARWRSFDVILRRGQREVVLGRVEQALITPTPRTLTFPWPAEAPGQGMTDVMLRIRLTQGGITRTVSPQPPTITVQRPGYWTVYGWRLLLLGGVCGAVTAVVVVGVRRRRRRARTRPEIIKVLGGTGVPLRPWQPVTLGGEGCTLAVPGVPAGTTLATVVWQGTRGELTLQPGEGVRLTMPGAAATGAVAYRIGAPLHFEVNEMSLEVTVFPGTEDDLGFGPSLVGVGNGLAGPGTFPESGRGLSDLNGWPAQLDGASSHGAGVHGANYI